MSTMPAQPPFDRAKAEAFASEVLTALNHGALCLMISVGHRTGLLDALGSMPPATATEIAGRTRLNERYVREWLGAMVTGRVIVFDPVTDRFSLPAEHAASLTRAAGGDNLAVFTQYIGELGQVESDIVECFRRGGGVPYARFPRFHDIMAEDSAQSVLSSLESHVLGLVPGLAEALQRGIRVLDVGCGRGLVILRLAEVYPRSRFMGLDLSDEAIAFARAEASRRRLTNIEFVARDASNLHETVADEAFDLITTFDAVHDQAQPLTVLRGIRRALTPAGVYLMQDINGTSHLDRDVDHPLGPLTYTISCMHCMTVSLAQGGEGLGAMWGEERTRDYLSRAGFRSIEVHRLDHDLLNNWYVVRK